MEDDEPNLGWVVLFLGVIACTFFLMGVASGTGTPRDEVPALGLAVAGIILVAFIIIASVVGAYHAGKRKR